MTRVNEDGVAFVTAEPVGKCELCNKVAETRPYGPNGEEVCFTCGMKDEPAAKAQFNKFLEGA